MKKLFSLFLLALLPVVVVADPVDKDAARQKAEAFFTKQSPSSARRARVQQDIRLALTNESYHVFNLGTEDGFVIISGDDCTDDILGYADSGTFDAEDMPENLRAWLQGYAEQIAWMKANNITNESSPIGERDKAARKVRAKIAPLLTSKWNQGNPYNRQTPLKVNDYYVTHYVTHCVTGCVATAMAQVMYYWYKKEGYETRLVNDIPGYVPDSDWYPALEGLTAPATFDWAHMTDEYDDNSTDTEKDAVAKLMKYVGYSVKMMYGNSSGADPHDIAPALTDYFGYKSARFFEADQYFYEDLQTVIYTDLAAGRPVLYGGQSTGGGHRFVCDGYDEEDYFHFNWGWGGKSDGYYKLLLCNPDEQGIGGSSTNGAYSWDQNAVCGIHPTQTVSLPIEPLGSAPENASVSDISLTDIDIPTLYEGETADIKVTLKNNNTTKPFNGIVGCRFGGLYFKTKVNIPPNSIEEYTVSITIRYWSGILSVYVLDVITGDDNYIGEKFAIVFNSRPDLEGTISIKENQLELGCPGTYQLGGDVASLPASSLHPRWQTSKDGNSRWKDITGATGTTYTPTIDDLDKYVRVIIKADGYHGELVSDKRKVDLPTLAGTVSLSGARPSPDTKLTYKLSGQAADLDPSLFSTQWQRSYYRDRGWKSLEGETEKSYTLKTEDIGIFFRVRVMANNHYGFLYSSPCQCVKKACTQQVSSPTLEVSTAYNQIRVTNPKTTQEYIIMTGKKAVNTLTESDWGSAKTFGEGDNFLFMGGTANTVNYVYTRVKETETTTAGTDVRMASIYFGETTYVQDIKLDLRKVNLSNNYTALERDDLGACYMQCGDRYRITVESVPAKATNFNGILGSKWLVRGYSRTSQWGKYYSDKECTTVIDADTYYKTVYFKPQDGTMINYMELRAEFTKGYNDVATEAFLVNIATEQGCYKIEQMYFEEATVVKGETVSGLKFSTRPSKATLNTISATVTSSEGTAPVISFNEVKKTFNVDATDATKGTYYYTVYVNGTAVSTMRVDVTTPPAEEIKLLPGKFTLDIGESLQLDAQQFPFGADDEVSWSSSDEDVATVSPDGVVNVRQWADIGQTATITATVGDLSATSEVTVAGEKYPLYMAGMQVTTRNKDRLCDVAANLSEEAMERWMSGEMEISYDGEVLRLKNAIINADRTNAPGLVLGKYGTIIVVEGDCSVSSTSDIGMKIVKTANIMGDGSLNIVGNEAAILLDGDSGNDYIRLVASDVNLSLTGTQHAIKGSEGDLCSVELSNVAALGQGNSGVISGLSGDLALENCYIQDPKGAELMNGSLWNGSTLADYFRIVRGEDPDGIGGLTPDPSPRGEGSIYNLIGQRLSRMQKGINIVNGKKVMMK